MQHCSAEGTHSTGLEYRTAPVSTLECRCATCRRQRPTQTRARRCAMTGPASHSIVTPPTLLPPSWPAPRAATSDSPTRTDSPTTGEPSSPLGVGCGRGERRGQEMAKGSRDDALPPIGAPPTRALDGIGIAKLAQLTAHR